MSKGNDILRHQKRDSKEEKCIHIISNLPQVKFRLNNFKKIIDAIKKLYQFEVHS